MNSQFFHPVLLSFIVYHQARLWASHGCVFFSFFLATPLGLYYLCSLIFKYICEKMSLINQ